MITSKSFTGLGVALATPFLPSGTGVGAGAVDMDAFERLVSSVVSGGADFLVVLGSTGEAATVLPEERDALVAATKAGSRGRPVVVGTGHNSTAAACELTSRAARSGADAALVVMPYYNKPQPAGIEAHFRAIASATGGLPMIAYNVPGRTGINLLPKDLARLWNMPEVLAVKESSGSLAQIGEIARTLPAGKALLSGDDALALAAIAVGATGLVSVAGNAVPAGMKALVAAALENRMDEARALNRKLLPLMDALFLESNPVPLKAALALAGIGSGAVRLPLYPASEATTARLAELLGELGIGPKASGSGASRETAR
jgi:4-hydroxy-tetrahydrodipicolinate synthase